MSASITQESPDHPDAIQLITELEDSLALLYPQESRHGLSVERLIREGVAFFVCRLNGEALGCGGIKLFGRDYGELKRMYVRPKARGQGLGRLMLKALAQHARQNGVSLLRLETGVHQKEAIGLYESFGFRCIPPFAEYKPDPLSLCYEMQISL